MQYKNLMPYTDRAKRLEYQRLYKLNRKNKNKITKGLVTDCNWVLVMGEIYKITTKNK